MPTLAEMMLQKANEAWPFHLWDHTLRMAVQIFPDGRWRFVRYPTDITHPMCVAPIPVSDHEFAGFIKSVQAAVCVLKSN